jgi:glutathione synthase/RimK-type ligase-like ATP-grasp enzyme
LSKPIIIFGARAPVALDLARCFAAGNFPVRLADSVTPFAASWSKVATHPWIQLAPARFAFASYCAQITQLCSEAELIIPTCEEVFYLAAAAEKAQQLKKIFAPPLATLRTLHSKIDFIQFAQSLGIQVPETHAIESQSALKAISGSSGQWVFKPEFSRFGTQTHIRPARAQIEKLPVSSESRWAVQAYVPGEEICLWTAARNGEIVGSAAYRPLWRLGRSASYAFESIPAPAALELASTLAKALALTGQMSFDIILDKHGQAIPIECNPRATSGLHLFGTNPALARAILGRGPPVAAPPGLCYLSPAMLLLGLPRALRKGQLRLWQNHVSSGQDALTRPGDRLPAWGAIVDSARFAWTGIRRGKGPLGQTTDDIEWNGATLL